MAGGARRRKYLVCLVKSYVRNLLKLDESTASSLYVLTDNERRPLPRFSDTRNHVHRTLREAQSFFQRVGEQPISIAGAQ